MAHYIVGRPYSDRCPYYYIIILFAAIIVLSNDWRIRCRWHVLYYIIYCNSQSLISYINLIITAISYGLLLKLTMIVYSTRPRVSFWGEGRYIIIFKYRYWIWKKKLIKIIFMYRYYTCVSLYNLNENMNFRLLYNSRIDPTSNRKQ